MISEGWWRRFLTIVHLIKHRFGTLSGAEEHGVGSAQETELAPTIWKILISECWEDRFIGKSQPLINFTDHVNGAFM